MFDESRRNLSFKWVLLSNESDVSIKISHNLASSMDRLQSNGLLFAIIISTLITRACFKVLRHANSFVTERDSSHQDRFAMDSLEQLGISANFPPR